MAHELFSQYATGATLYAVLRSQSTGEYVLVADGTTEAPTAAHFVAGDYTYSMADSASVGGYDGAINPIPATDDFYDVLIYVRAGANAAVSDQMIQQGIAFVRGGVIVTREVDLISVPNATAVTAIQSGLATTTALSTFSTAVLAIFNGMSSLPKWLRAMFRSDTPDSTAIGEINTGGGAYVPADMSLETIDGGGGGGGSTPEEIWTYGTRTLTSSSPNVTVSSPVLPTGKAIIIRGNDYATADGLALPFESTGWPDLTSAAATFTVQRKLTLQKDINGTSATILAPTGSAVVTVPLTRAQTLALVPNVQYEYDLTAVLSDGNTVTLAAGDLCVRGIPSTN